MEDLLLRLMEGIDPSDPAASWLLFKRMMGLIDWWLITWLTLLCAAVGGLIGWWRGAFWRDLMLGAALGPIGWIVSLLIPRPSPKCAGCGRATARGAKFCAHCGAPLPPPLRSR
jgi:hypothetical protein